jgi:NTE family protein
LQYIVCCLVLLFMSGCASYGKIENLPVTESSGAQEYSLRSFTRADKNDDLDLLLTFSGGGTRAAAMAYGVMQELRDTTISINGETRRLLDEVDTISSVSGGAASPLPITVSMVTEYLIRLKTRFFDLIWINT